MIHLQNVCTFFPRQVTPNQFKLIQGGKPEHLKRSCIPQSLMFTPTPTTTGKIASRRNYLPIAELR